MIWDALFVQRTPISEQCRGVVTTLTLLGLGELVQKRDITSIRAWFTTQTPESYTDLVMDLAKIKYVVMTNIPFDKVLPPASTLCPGKQNVDRLQTARFAGRSRQMGESWGES